MVSNILIFHAESNENGDPGFSEDESDDEGWITPSNLKRNKAKKSASFCDEEEIPEQDWNVVCITADFSVQNVLKHIGLSVMGVDGKIIQHLKTYILRCYACFKTTSVMTKVSALYLKRNTTELIGT